FDDIATDIEAEAGNAGSAGDRRRAAVDRYREFAAGGERIAGAGEFQAQTMRRRHPQQQRSTSVRSPPARPAATAPPDQAPPPTRENARDRGPTPVGSPATAGVSRHARRWRAKPSPSHAATSNSGSRGSARSKRPAGGPAGSGHDSRTMSMSQPVKRKAAAR